MKPPTPVPPPPLRRRYLWWAQLLAGVLLLAVPTTVFFGAGGQTGQLLVESADGTVLPSNPTAIAATVFFGMAVFGALSEFEARRTERRHANQWHTRQHPAVTVTDVTLPEPHETGAGRPL